MNRDAEKSKKGPNTNHSQQRLGRLFAGVSDSISFLCRSAWPIIDFIFRVWLAKTLLVSGFLMAQNWNTSLLLAAQEYPISGLNPSIEAFLGVAAEIGGGFCLLFGFWTRLGALAVLTLAVFTQLFYIKLDLNLFWAMLMLGYVMRGPGPISLDYLLGPGLGRSPLPFASAITHFFNSTRTMASNLYLLILRLWVAITFILLLIPHTPTLSAWFPIHSAQLLFGSIAFLWGLLLFIGFANRFIAIALLLMILFAFPSVGAFAYAGYWTMTLAILFVFGAGLISLDQWILNCLKKYYPQLSGKPAFSLAGLPHIVVVGAGFGGIACVKALRHTPAKVTLIDRNNYHLFQPLLYQVATGNLSPADIAVSIRSIFLEQFNADVMLGNVVGIDKENRQVLMANQTVHYDYLVIATGATHSYFGKDLWAPYAPGLKDINDAISVRCRILETLEKAELVSSKAERTKLLNFIIVGGGPTGVELAGAIAELTFGMEKDFRHFDPAESKIILVQAAPRILPTFSEEISASAQQSLEKIGVKVFVNSRVEQIDEEGVIVNGKRIYSESVLWAAGVTASPAAEWLAAETDKAGRVNVNDDLSLPGHHDIFIIGDTALSTSWHGNPVPGLAPAAKQGGVYVAKNISAKIFQKEKINYPPFKYQHKGSLATIGRKAAVAELTHIKLKGALAWWLWGLVHMSFLFGGRNRVNVTLNWIWSYFTFRANNLLITKISRRL